MKMEILMVINKFIICVGNSDY